MRKMQTHLYKHTKEMKCKEKWERGREEEEEKKKKKIKLIENVYK